MSPVPRRRRRGSASDPSDLAPPGNPVAGYEILAEIGRGASGRVYRATQARLSREVALKVLDAPPDDRDARRRFERELSITVRLGSHPHIAQVLDAGQAADGRPYLAMELFERGSAGDWLARYGPFSSADAVRAGTAIADALAAAHSAGVLHRDVKPENILLSEYGPALTDFGIARPTDQLDRTSSFSQFTPWHAAPEVLLDGAPTEVADVYSLASTIFTLLDGRPPFAGPPGETLLAFQRRVLTEDHRRLPATVEPSLGEVITAALARDPDRRIATAVELRDRLRAAATGGVGPTVAGPADAGPVGPTPADRRHGGGDGDCDGDGDARVDGNRASGGASGPGSLEDGARGAGPPGADRLAGRPPDGGPSSGGVPIPDPPIGAETLPPGSGPLERGPDLAATAPRRQHRDPEPTASADPPPAPPAPTSDGTPGDDVGAGPATPPPGPLGDRGDLSLTRAAGTAPDPPRPDLDTDRGRGRARWPWVIVALVVLTVVLLVAWFAWFRPDDPPPPPPPDTTPPTVSVAPPAAAGTPTDVEVEELDATTVELTWTDTTGGAGTTAVLVAAEGGASSVVEVERGATRQVVSDLEPAIGYCFQVRVFAATADSPEVLDFRADPVCIRGAVPADPDTTTTTGG